ncbi:hypothetical protein BKA65DRAFT_510063 [Rhexocercosporidium sp. MPI-PUGE-AT-0058]|nr:hypothetical protein BKA65DRAFT_510063 [Rhexocercosporidium sp. MPI-PUGE-AT-0058]
MLCTATLAQLASTLSRLLIPGSSMKGKEGRGGLSTVANGKKGLGIRERRERAFAFCMVSTYTHTHTHSRQVLCPVMHVSEGGISDVSREEDILGILLLISSHLIQLAGLFKLF